MYFTKSFLKTQNEIIHSQCPCTAPQTHAQHSLSQRHACPIFYRAPHNGRKCQSLSCFRLLASPRTIARQAPLSMGFPRQEYWSGLSFPFPGDLPEPGIQLVSPTLQVDSLPTEPPGKLPQQWRGSANRQSRMYQPLLAKRSKDGGTSLVVQRLRLHAPNAGDGAQSLVRGLEPTCRNKDQRVQVSKLRAVQSNKYIFLKRKKIKRQDATRQRRKNTTHAQQKKKK